MLALARRMKMDDLVPRALGFYPRARLGATRRRRRAAGTGWLLVVRGRPGKGEPGLGGEGGGNGCGLDRVYPGSR